MSCMRGVCVLGVSGYGVGVCVFEGCVGAWSVMMCFNGGGFECSQGIVVVFGGA